MQRRRALDPRLLEYRDGKVPLERIVAPLIDAITLLGAGQEHANARDVIV